MTDTAVEAAGTRQGRIGVVTLLTGAFGRLRARAVPLVVLMAVVAGLQSALMLAAQWGGVERPPDGRLTVAYVAYALAGNLIPAVADTTALMLFVRGPDRVWRVDRGFIACVALLFVAAMLNSARAFLVGPVDRSDMARLYAQTSVSYAVWLVLGYLRIRLMLWPAALVDGRRDLGPVRAWTAMRGVTLSAIFATLIIMLPVVVATSSAQFALISSSQLDQTWLAQRALALTIGQLATLATLAMAVTAYTLRVEGPSKVADLFD